MTDSVAGDNLVEDRFRWLEEDSDPAVMAWQTDADAMTVRELAGSAYAATVTDAVQSTFVDLHTASAPERFGAYWFRKVVPAGRSDVVLQIASGPREDGRVIVDPRDEAPNATFGFCQVSPDGSLVLACIDVEGAWRSRIVRADDGALVRDLPQLTQPGICKWSPDGCGIYYGQLGIDQVDGRDVPVYQLWWQPLEGEAERQSVDLGHPFGWPIAAADGRWVGLCANQTSPRLRWFKRPGDKDWTRFDPDGVGRCQGAFIGDDFWAITDDSSGCGRLVAIPLASSADRSTWRELIPDREGHKLQAITRCGDYVALSAIEAGIMTLRSIGIDGRERGNVPLPADGAFGLFPLQYIGASVYDIVGPDGDGCTFMHSSLDRGPGAYRADLATLALEELEAPSHLPDREVLHYVAQGPQGPISYWVMRKTSTPLDGSAAAIVMGYGGFNVPEIPHYTPMATAWTELGGIWVHTQIRGGGERDTAFWEAGRMHRKQGTFDDFFAVIEDLHARNITTPARTGIWGTSNGGLLVGATVSQRPELLGAAVAQVPVLDMVVIGKDAVTLNIARADYGDPDNPVDAAVMRAYSPYHNVRPGVSYPALLCDTGAADLLCPPWHSRKMIAAIQAASASDRKARLRVRDGTGHNQMTPGLFMERDIEELTFFCDELMGERTRRDEAALQSSSVA